MRPDFRTLVIVPCGALKIWSYNFLAGPTPARDAYISSAFRLNRKYAEIFGADWRILSAWYGILHPGQLICDYDAKFRSSDLDPRHWWRLQGMFQQARALPRFDHVVATWWNNLPADRPKSAARSVSSRRNHGAIRRAQSV
jgi:hypothetical protein